MTRIYTIGHSNRSIEDFIALLEENGIEALVDIRTIPKSRTNPQFGQDQLPGSVESTGIQYIYMKDLGGLRKTTSDSPNAGWRNLSFRGYADYMQTDAFADTIEALIELGERNTAAIMCAEAVPWRCHRSLVGDAMLVRGHEVIDIMGPGKTKPNPLTPFAEVDGTTITYPPYGDNAG